MVTQKKHQTVKSKRIIRKLKAKLKKAHSSGGEDDGEGNWLVSYADMMTLLAMFFIVVSAFSSPDPSKMEKLKKATSESMGGEYINPYNALKDEIQNEMDDIQVEQGLSIEALLDGLKITINANTFFQSGSFVLKDQANQIVLSIGKALKKSDKDFKVFVEGHTDDAPMRSATIPSNWVLSLRRASEVVEKFERLGIDRKRLRPLGLADTQPAVDPTGLTGEELFTARDQNRRIVIRLQKILPRRMK